MSLEKIIIGIIAALFQAISGTIVILRQSKRKYNKKTKILYLITFFTYFLVVSFLIANELRFLFFNTFLILSIKYILKQNWVKSTLFSFNTTMIFSISELFITILLVQLGIDSYAMINDLTTNLILNLLISVGTIVIIFIPIVNKMILKEISIFEKNTKNVNYLYILLLILYLLTLKNGLELILKSSYYITILFTVVVGMIVVKIINNEHKAEKLKEQNQQMLNYVTKYEKIITEQGKTNHEFKNQLMVIKGYAQLNSKKLTEYLDSITNDFNKTTSSYLISQLNKFPDGGIKGLLYYKLSTMEDEKINYEIEVETGVKTKLKKLEIEAYKNITKVLGVLLDNAIEASKKSKEKNVIILVTKDNKKVTFNISNTYKGKIEIEKIGTGYTTKGNGHGYGLRLVNDIIENQKELSIEKELDNGYYTTKLIINTYQKKDN